MNNKTGKIGVKVSIAIFEEEKLNHLLAIIIRKAIIPLKFFTRAFVILISVFQNLFLLFIFIHFIHTVDIHSSFYIFILIFWFKFFFIFQFILLHVPPHLSYKSQ